MLVKLKLNKFILLFLSFSLFSCVKEGDRILMLPDTEFSCPNGLTVLIKYVKAQDVRNAILKHVEEKKKFGTSEKYTVIVLEDKRSMKIDDVRPEDALFCSLRESEYHPIKRKYVY